MHGLQERGLSVPGDVSVAGFDATPQSAYLRPSLTTVDSDYESRGRNAILGLLAQIDGTTDPQFEAATVSLLARQSTAAPGR
jgi:DNA-binding LacI/PurR family transcriptional regulator